MTNDAQDLLAALEKEGILRKGHFVLSGGDHSGEYIDHDSIYANPFLVTVCGQIVADMFKTTIVETVIGPALGGNTLAHETARCLSLARSSNAHVAYSEKNGSEFTIVETHKQFVVGRNILFVDDALTTGRTLRNLIKVVREIGGRPAYVGVIWNRGDLVYLDGMDVRSIITQRLPSWPALLCPLCAQGVPINTECGHGKEFLESLNK